MTKTNRLASLRRLYGGMPSRLSRFRREEHGTLTIFSVYLTILIFMLGGIAVDVMRSEQVRTAVQNIEDTAVLAASNLNQTLDSEAVVKDYFQKAGMENYLKSVQVTASDNYRKVSATATTSVPTLFMKLEGINSLNTVNNSTALESIGDVEVALALDNSGSMGETISSTPTTTCTTKTRRKNSYQSCRTTYVTESKLDALKVAASQFVDTMFDQVQPGALTMSIFPYDAHVNIGNDLLQYLNVSQEQTTSKCIDFQATDFNTTAIDPSTLLQRAANTNIRSNTNNINSNNVECNSNSYRDSIVFSNNRTDLKTTISNMQDGGYTSIDSGVKWAAASLDPSWQPVVDDLISAGKLTSGYTGRPAAYNDRTHMKVLIVMSDGENTTRYQLKPGFYAGNSSVFTNSDDPNNFSFYDSSQLLLKYFWTVDGLWHDKPYASGGGVYLKCTSYYYGTCTGTTAVTATGTATELTYPQLWDMWSPQYFLNKIIVPAYGSSAYSTWYNKIVDPVSSGSMDTYTHNICTAAKNNGVIVYSIGFLTSDAGRAVLKDCATAPSYYFDSQGADIGSIFAKIAASIVHLRLIQ